MPRCQVQLNSTERRFLAPAAGRYGGGGSGPGPRCASTPAVRNPLAIRTASAVVVQVVRRGKAMVVRSCLVIGAALRDHSERLREAVIGPGPITSPLQKGRKLLPKRGTARDYAQIVARLLRRVAHPPPDNLCDALIFEANHAAAVVAEVGTAAVPPAVPGRDAQGDDERARGARMHAPGAAEICRQSVGDHIPYEEHDAAGVEAVVVEELAERRAKARAYFVVRVATLDGAQLGV